MSHRKGNPKAESKETKDREQECKRPETEVEANVSEERQTLNNSITL
jgi:hypothetical protein